MKQQLPWLRFKGCILFQYSFQYHLFVQDKITLSTFSCIGIEFPLYSLCSLCKCHPHEGWGESFSVHFKASSLCKASISYDKDHF